MFRLRFVRDIRDSVKIPNVLDVLVFDPVAKKMVSVGKKDRCAECDSFRELASIKNKLMRFQNGDVNALNVRKGIYADISGIPTDYNSMHNVVNEALTKAYKNGFNSIPEYIQSIIDLSNNKSNNSNSSIDNNTFVDNPIESGASNNES